MHGGLAGYLGAICFTIGAAAFGFLVPALAGYIAFAIADRPGLVPGFVVGAVSLLVGAGFLGGLVGGIIAGFAALWISRWKLPAGVRGLQPVVIIPLLATLISSGLMVHRPGQAAGRGADRPGQLAEQPDRHAGDPARHRAGPDDVLRPGRPGQQGGLRLRHHRAHRRPLRRAAATSSW